MNGVVGIGVIGCGEATQALHVPAISSLGAEARIVACVDSSPVVAEAVAARVGARVCTTVEELVRADDVDVVLVATPDSYHVDHAIAACEAGKAVLVEKPLALNSRMAREVADAAEQYDVPVVVGYPHVYDPAVQQTQELLAGNASSFGAFQVVVGPNEKFTSDVLDPIRGGEPDPMLAQMGQFAYGLAATEMFGDDIRLSDVLGYMMLLTLVVHEIPVIRRLFGDDLTVEFARFHEAPDATSMLGYAVDCKLSGESGRVSLYSEIVPFKLNEWRFEVRDDRCQVTVRYPTTYAAAAPSSCTVTSERDGSMLTETYAERYTTGFRREWQHMLAVVRGEAAPLTSAADAVRDLELIEEITRSAVTPTAVTPTAVTPTAVTPTAVSSS